MVNFLKYRWLYFLFSGIVIGFGLFSILRWGYIYSIDFVGGTNLEYKLDKKVKKDSIQKIISDIKIELINLEYTNNIIDIRTKIIDDNKERELRNNLEKKLAVKIITLRFETVGPTLGKETVVKTIIASFLGMIGILLYMSFAFKGVNSAIAAILAAIHDLLVIFGCYSLLSHFFGAQLDSLFVTAILTSMSLSVHDTIVVFDKIREYKSGERETIEYFANKALTETMVRSINNSMTIIFMLLALILLGGATVKFFVATLLIGTITGTYSSPFIATPILVWLEKRKKIK